MKKNTKKKIIIIMVILIIALGVGGFFTWKKLTNNNSKTETNTVEVLDSINGYDYHLEDRDSEIYKETFFKLKELLEKSETIEYEQYAKYIAELFLIDFYTIENKISKYDVGSLDFIYPEEKEKFQNKAMDTMYKMVLDNSTNTRKQDLPKVTKVDLKEPVSTMYPKGDKKLEGYTIDATISYQKDLGYDKNVNLTLVKEENKIYVVKLTNPDA